MLSREVISIWTAVKEADKGKANRRDLEQVAWPAAATFFKRCRYYVRKTTQLFKKCLFLNLVGGLAGQIFEVTFTLHILAGWEIHWT